MTDTIWKAALACGVVAALGTLGCERRGENPRVGERLEETTQDTGERLSQAGKDLTAGVTYEVAKVDKNAKTVEVRRANAMPGVAEETELQSGKDSITFTFDDLGSKVEGDKPGQEIAEELHEGENVTVFMDENKNVVRITYYRSHS